MQRSFLIFSNAIHEETTLEKYVWGLNGFLKFYKLKDYDSLASMDVKMLQGMIEDFIMTKKSENLSRSGIKNYLNPLKVFCDTNDLMINWKKISRLVPKQGKKSGGIPYTTEQVAKTIRNESQLRNKALIHCLAAGGMRVGAFPELKLKDIVNYKDRCKMITVYADSSYEYITFWTPEASAIFGDYLTVRKNDNEFLNSDSPAFRTTYRLGSQKSSPMTLSAIQGIIRRALERAGLRPPEGKINGRFQTMMDHGFRKRWNTIVKNTDGMKIITAEKMMGHSIRTIPLDETYNIPEAEKLFKEFKKAIPELTVDSSERKQAELDQVKNEKSELKTANEALQKYKIQMDNLEKKVETLGGLVEQGNFSKIQFEKNEENKKLLLESLEKEHQIVKLNDNRFIIGKKIPTEFRFQ